MFGAKIYVNIVFSSGPRIFCVIKKTCLYFWALYQLQIANIKAKFWVWVFWGVDICNGSVGQDQRVPKVCPLFDVDKDQLWYTLF